MMNWKRLINHFWSVTKNVFSNKLSVFNEVKKQRFVLSVGYLAIFLAFFVTISTKHYLQRVERFISEIYATFGVETAALPESVSFLVLFGTILFITMFLFTFLKYWLMHVALLIFEESEYSTTYKALSYSIGPGFVAMPFFLLSLALYPFISSTVFLVPFIISTFIFLSLEIYNIYVRCKALSLMYDIPLWKAFVAIYILGFIFWNVALIFIIFLCLVPVVILL